MSQRANDGAPRKGPHPSSMPPPVPGTGKFTRGRPTAGIRPALGASHAFLSRRPYRYRAFCSVVLGTIGVLLVLIFIMHTDSTTESGHLWWKKTTTTSVPMNDRLPLLVIGVALMCAAALLAWSALRVFKMQDTNVAALVSAQATRQKRAAAMTISERDPQMARDLGIGRPDLPRQYDDGGLVDVNSAPASTIAKWLDLSAAEADRIVSVRGELGKFHRVEELLTLVDLAPDSYDRVSERVVLL